MPRPCKCRRVAFMPGITYFKPAGIPMRDLDEVCLSVEELEAIRLKDLEGLEQEQAAGRMNISRPTFQRVLYSARQKIAEALLKGKAIRIEGGNFQLSSHRFRCAHGHEWEMTSESTAELACPVCRIKEVAAVESGVIRRHRRCCEQE